MPATLFPIAITFLQEYFQTKLYLGRDNDVYNLQQASKKDCLEKPVHEGKAFFQSASVEWDPMQQKQEHQWPESAEAQVGFHV